MFSSSSLSNSLSLWGRRGKGAEIQRGVEERTEGFHISYSTFVHFILRLTYLTTFVSIKPLHFTSSPFIFMSKCVHVCLHH